MSSWKIDWETQDYDKNDKLIGITWRPPFTIRAKSFEEAKTSAMKRAHKEMQKLRRKYPEDFRCSKRHTPRILGLKEKNGTVIEYQEKILKNIAPGCDIRQHYRPFLKQSELKVNHLHIHLQPRELDDELYRKCQIYHKDVFKELTEEEINKIFKLLLK